MFDQIKSKSQVNLYRDTCGERGTPQCRSVVYASQSGFSLPSNGFMHPDHVRSSCTKRYAVEALDRLAVHGAAPSRKVLW